MVYIKSEYFLSSLFHFSWSKLVDESNYSLSICIFVDVGSDLTSLLAMCLFKMVYTFSHFLYPIYTTKSKFMGVGEEAVLRSRQKILIIGKLALTILIKRISLKMAVLDLVVKSK